jgi:hypothetical protein
MLTIYTRFLWLLLPVISFGLCLNYIHFSVKGVYYLTGPSLFWINNGPYFLTLFFFVSILAFFVRASKVQEEEDNEGLSFFARSSIIIFKFLCNVLSIQLSYITFRLLRLEKDRLDFISLFGDRVSFLSDYTIHRKWSLLELQESLMLKLSQLNLSMPSEQKDFFIFQSGGSMKNLNILLEDWVQKLSTPLPPLSFRQKLVNGLTSYFSSGLDFMFDNPKTTITVLAFSSIFLYFSWSYFSNSSNLGSRLDEVEQFCGLAEQLPKLITANAQVAEANHLSVTERVSYLSERVGELAEVVDNNSVIMGAVLDFLSESDPTFMDSFQALLSKPPADSFIEVTQSSVVSQIDISNNNA